jgi:hypothetical protein
MAAISEEFNDYEQQAVDSTQDLLLDGEGDGERELIVTMDPLEGLDREELAELVMFQVSYSTSARPGAENNSNSEPAEIISDLVVNVNSERSDFTASGIQTEERLAGDDLTGNGEFSAQSAVNDGEILRTNRVLNAPFSSDANSNGGSGSGMQPTIYRFNYRDELGGGPVLDRFDEIVHRIKLKARNYVGQCKLEAKFQYYWVTEEDQERRTSF